MITIDQSGPGDSFDHHQQKRKLLDILCHVLKNYLSDTKVDADYDAELPLHDIHVCIGASGACTS
jgi:hypothetical protein